MSQPIPPYSSSGPYATLAAKSGQAPVLQSVQMRGQVTGLLFELELEQHYANASAVSIEAVYTFPLPFNAVLLGMECALGERVSRGTVVAKADAEEGYEAALEAGDSAIMLERAAEGVYSASLGNLLPGERANIRLRYAQLLSFEQGQVRIQIPTALAPRYGDPASAGVRDHQRPETSLLADYPLTLQLGLTGAVAAGAVSSPSHALAVRQTGCGVEVTLAATARLDRDFVLVVSGLAGQSLAVYGQDGTGEVALASFCPAGGATPAAPVNVKILVDCSGSMSGDSISSARRALHEVLKQLDRTDRFSYSRFGSEVVHCTDTLIAATSRAVREGARWIAKTDAVMGGTEMHEALRATFALGQPVDADILLVTDGEVWDVERLVASALTAGQRIFAVGIGAAPAASLLQSLALGSGGACEFVGVHDDVAAAIVRSFQRMRQRPVKDVAVTWASTPAWQTCPAKAVFMDETVHAFAGFAGSCADSATLSWQAQDATLQESLQTRGCFVAGDTLARVAASERMRGLAKGEQHALALAYQLVTASTNLLIVHARDTAEQGTGLPELRTIAQMAVSGRAGLGSSATGQMTMSKRQPAQFSLAQRQAEYGHRRLELYEVPEFLRATGASFDGTLYRAQLRVFLDRYSARDNAGGAAARFPTALEEVAGQLPASVLLDLEALVTQGFSEQEILQSFIVNLAACFVTVGIASRLLRRIGALGRFGAERSRLDQSTADIAWRAYEARLAPHLERASTARTSRIDASPQ